MHDEDCQLPSLDWLTDSVKSCKSSALSIADPVASSFLQQTKRPKTQTSDQKSVLKNVDFSKEAVKPPYSYAELITLAMRHHGQCKVLLSDIYDYVRKNFAWYRRTDITWQNSIRHNLSLNKQFIKLPRKEGEKGKGSYWMLDLNVMDSSGLKMKKSGSSHGRMKLLEKNCKPTLNPAVLSYLKKQNDVAKKTNPKHQRPFSTSTDYAPQVMETGVDEAFHPEDIKLTTDEENHSYGPSVSPPTVFSFMEYEDEQGYVRPTDPGTGYYQLQPMNEFSKSPVWWKNSECQVSSDSNEYEQPSLPRFMDAFANSNFENQLSPNGETEMHPWQDVDLKITDDCLFFDLSM